ncbi:sodium:calcium antiporter [Thermodesulfobacterium sp. TA1]|uniref:sodium:calcium antiporter n=1 Tax=Thermodesulfobacterium sp. TA1 TaxID=2234087 RepID=UPI001232EA85|nr:sodium:calcium antiporter [Thermodesulfobacterium sp. TA1]QER42098.1 sodium:calcium antiporter [Thermodesulfobacterium sp. TA1]
MDVILLITALLIILICAEVFTNGVENLGKALSLSQAVVGSVLAAVGTALPETIIPLVAILMYKGEEGSAIGIGAILGAPFMLVTVGLFLVGLGVFLSYFLKRRKVLEVHLEPQTFKRDFTFFLISFSLAIFFPFFLENNRFVHYVIAFLLLINYIIYLFFTFRAESLELESEEKLYLGKLAEKLLGIKKFSKVHMVFLSFTQVSLALMLMVKGAHLFVEKLEILSRNWGLNPLLFALLIAPVATELPEKFNSLIWTMKERDILALGNMTGAMVFQSTFPVSVGLIFTNWQVEGLALISAIIAIALGGLYLFFLTFFKRVPLYLFLISGWCYLVYGYLVIKSFFG